MSAPDLIGLLAEIQQDAERGLGVIETGKRAGVPANGTTALKDIREKVQDALDTVKHWKP